MRKGYGWIAAVFMIVLCCRVVRNEGGIVWADPPEEDEDYIEMKVTVRAYCPCRKCCGKNADGRTADGRRIKKTDYTLAVSPDLEDYMPMGSSWKIKGYGSRSVVRDRTHRRRWRQIEVLMTVWKRDPKTRKRLSPHRRAQLWGHKTMVLKVPLKGAARSAEPKARR